MRCDGSHAAWVAHGRPPRLKCTYIMQCRMCSAECRPIDMQHIPKTLCCQVADCPSGSQDAAAPSTSPPPPPPPPILSLPAESPTTDAHNLSTHAEQSAHRTPRCIPCARHPQVTRSAPRAPPLTSTPITSHTARCAVRRSSLG